MHQQAIAPGFMWSTNAARGEASIVAASVRQLHLIVDIFKGQAGKRHLLILSGASYSNRLTTRLSRQVTSSVANEDTRYYTGVHPSPKIDHVARHEPNFFLSLGMLRACLTGELSYNIFVGLRNGPTHAYDFEPFPLDWPYTLPAKHNGLDNVSEAWQVACQL